MRLVIDKKNHSFDILRDFYIAILIEREKEESKKVFKENWTDIKYRGNQFLETGYIFAPYIPVMVEPAKVSESNFQPSGIMSRYAKTTLNKNLYGRITVGELL